MTEFPERLLAAVASGDVDAVRAVLEESKTQIGLPLLERARRLALAGRAQAADALLRLHERRVREAQEHAVDIRI